MSGLQWPREVGWEESLLAGALLVAHQPALLLQRNTKHVMSIQFKNSFIIYSIPNKEDMNNRKIDKQVQTPGYLM